MEKKVNFEKIEEEIREDIYFGAKQYLEGGITHQEFLEEIKQYFQDGKTSMGSIIPKSLKQEYKDVDIEPIYNRFGESTGKYRFIY